MGGPTRLLKKLAVSIDVTDMPMSQLKRALMEGGALFFDSVEKGLMRRKVSRALMKLSSSCRLPEMTFNG